MRRGEPVATYRLQLHAGFRFEDAAAIADHVAELGASHVYVSPPFEAAPGSPHGYDVADPGRLGAERGGEAGFARLGEALERHGLGLLVDLVPNHMTTAVPANAWWNDVLADGSASRYAHYFDVDWSWPAAGEAHRIVLPVLGEPLDALIERGEIRLRRDGGQLALRVPGRGLPLSPETAAPILRRAARRAGSAPLATVADQLADLGRPSLGDRMGRRVRHARKLALQELSAFLAAAPALAAAIEDELRALESDPAALRALVHEQRYRPTFWRDAPRRRNYRRFFDVDDLVGLCADDQEVFDATHALALAWVREGRADGLRIDHVDGLRDPDRYLERLRAAAPDAWILVEKILHRGERLPESWPVDGTTGYEFLELVQGLFVDPAGEGPLCAAFAELTGRSASWDELVRETKLRLVPRLFPSELARLARHAEVALGIGREEERAAVPRALVLVLAHVPVYRTYFRPGRAEPRPEDLRIVDEAVRAALGRADPDAAAILPELGELLALRRRSEDADELVWRFQQLATAVAAKAVEDTAFYLYHPLACLNEVGGDPSCFGTEPEAFHAAMRRAARERPRSMLALSTHDTKRGEDVRARIALLSEVPGEWIETVARWRRIAEPHRSAAGPDPAAEWLLFQTLVGAWPIEAERAVRYMRKAAREAEEHSSWVEPDERYEAALASYVEAVLADERLRAEIAGFAARLADPGRWNSLAQTVVQLTAPGVPDVYQGTEVWESSLVDPDNRRPVDFDRLRRASAAIEGLSAEEAWARRTEGLPKLFLTRRALALRRARPATFGPGSFYEPLAVRGERAECAIAYVRAAPDGGPRVAVIAPRLPMRLADGFGDTVCELPRGSWRDVLAGARREGGPVDLARLLERFPVALLAELGAAA